MALTKTTFVVYIVQNDTETRKYLQHIRTR